MRNIGLDIARSMAILMVLVSHSRMFFDQYADMQWLSYNGFFGVELFFVLSGFLIGRILIKEIVEKPNINNLITFYKRRWYRTLPLYFLMVIILLFLGTPFHWTNLVFLQNFSAEHSSFLPVSWSLSIEEWFYLLVPLVFLIIFMLAKIKNKGAWFIIITTTLIVLINILRYYIVINSNPAWDIQVRRHIFLRMDSILTGVLFAGISIYYKKIYDLMKPSYLYLISISGLATCGFYYVFTLDAGKEIINSSVFGRTFLFSIVSMLFALLVVALEKTKIRNLIAGKLFYFLSTTSYAVYLVHFVLFVYIKKFNSMSLQWSWFLLLVSLVSTYMISYLLYNFFEEPILRYRDRDRNRNIKSKLSNNTLYEQNSKV